MKVKNAVYRNTGIDFLKILLAFMVISIHFCAPATGAVAKNCDVMPMKLFVIALMGLAYPAVNCYVLITSYFLYGQKKSIKSVLYSLSKLWIALVIFSVLGYVATCMLEYQSFSSIEFVKRFFPIIRGEWWFMSVYFALMISMPFLLDFVDQISIENHRMIVIISFFICSFFPFFTKYEENLGLGYGYSYLWFAVLFFIGTYLHRVNIVEKCNGFVCFLGYVFCGAFFQAFSLLPSRVPFLQGYTLSMYDSFVVCIQSVFLFLAFVNIKFEKWGEMSSIIAKLASLSMASYIFHCQEDIEYFFWKTTTPSSYADSYSLFGVYILTVIVLYTVSVILELIRRKLMSVGNAEKKILNGISCLSKWAYNLIDSIVVRIMERNTKGEDLDI